MDEMIEEIVALWVALYSPEGDPIAPSFSLTTAPAGVSAAVRLGSGSGRGDHSVCAKPTASAAVAALRDMMRREARTAVDRHTSKVAALRAALGEAEPQPVAEAVSPPVPAVGSMWRSYDSRRLCTVKRVDASGVHLAAAGCAMETVGLCNFYNFYERFEAARPTNHNPIDRDD